MSGTLSSKVVLALLLLVAFGPAAQGQPAFRVKDLNTTRSEGIPSEYGPNAFMDGFVASAGTVYFGASDGIHGFEPWRSDGTAAGTRLVADVCPGSCASQPHGFAVVGRNVFFLADDGFHGPELWKSDGTAAGTALVKDLLAAGEIGSLHGLAELSGRLIFALDYYGERSELWTSDGTAAGTFRLAQFGRASLGNNLVPLARLGRKLFFVAWAPAHGEELWMTDGTAAGTVLLKDVNPGPSGSAYGNPEKTVAVAGGKLFFLTNGPQGGLWVSDGTPSGTVPVTGPDGPYNLRELISWGREVAFFASRDRQVLELWRSDGTAAGTRAVKKISMNSYFLSFVAGRLFFSSDCEIWASDGTARGTLSLRSFGSGFSCTYNRPVPLTQGGGGGKLLFTADDGVRGREVWQTDGTPAGTALVADLYPGPASSTVYGSGAFAGGRWYFRARSGEDVGFQLWTTTGTAANTRMLRINRQASGLHVDGRGGLVGPRAFLDGDGKLLFQGGDGVTGAELAQSDGTAAGTFVIKDLKPGGDASLPGELLRIGATVFFRTDAGTGSEKLWRTDGTAAGTQMLFAPGHLHFAGLFSPRDLTPLGDRLVFAGAWWDDFSNNLLESDGTADGTVAIDAASAAHGVQGIVPLHAGRVLFQAGEELWTSDRTAAGTSLLGAAPTLAYRRDLKDVSSVRDGVLLFAGSTPANGEELWRSDGTEAGTYRLAEIVPGPGAKPLGPFATAGAAVFFAAGGDELWKNDASGTTLVRKLPPGDPAFGIRSLTALGSKVYFTYHDNQRGHELWTSDGTEAGTVRLRDLLPGAGSSHPRHLRALGSVLLFSASDGVHGFEPWQSDGTGGGTRMIQDIAPGSLSSSPTEFTTAGPNVYFAANDGTSGFELWAVPRQTLLTAGRR